LIVLCYLTKFVKETFYSLFKLDICFHLYYSINRHSSDLCSKILRHGSAKERTWFYMKKTTKILSVFMALLMVVTCIPMTAFAQDRDTSSLDAYINKDNLAVVVEDLLTALGDRKEEIAPSVLAICFQVIDALKEQAAADGVDVMNAKAEDLADSLMNYLNVVLADADLNNEIKDFSGLIGMVLGGVKIDLNSVDGILETLAAALDYLKGKGKSFCGDAAGFNTAPLKKGTGRNKVVITTKNSNGIEIVNALLGFISEEDNVAIIKKVVKGDLELGQVNDLANSFASLNLEETVNGLLGDNVAILINGLLYDNLIKGDSEVALADSAYAKFTSDELLAAALLKLISGKDATQTEAAEVAVMSLNDIIGKYGDAVIASFAIEPLNTDVKKALNDLIAMDPQLDVLKTIINMDYEFKADTFNFAAWTESGLFSNLNNIVCTIAEVILQPSVVAELGLKKGGNKDVNDNLTSVFGYILKTLAANNGGKLEFSIDGTAYSFDFSGFTADKIAGKSLEDMVVAVVSLFYPTLLGMDLPAEVASLEQLAGYTAYVCIDKFMVKDANIAFDKDYSDLVLANGKVRDISVDQWNNVLGEMGMDVAAYWLNVSTNINLDVDALKAKGFTWEDIFEDIVDWALNYIDGLPAVADHLTTERGVKDGSAWYKLNVIFNELFPMGFINDCGDETFTFDFYNAVMGKIVPALYDCDFAAFADIIDEKGEDSPFAKGLINSVLDLVDNLLFSIFSHECGDAVKFEKPATATHDGYKGTYCKANGHYDDVEVIPATGVQDPTTESTTEPTTDPSTQPSTDPSTQPSTDPQPPVGDYVLGDANGDGKVTAMDARTALRAASKIEPLEGTKFLAADANKDGKLTAMDARMILRHSARVELLPTA